GAGVLDRDQAGRSRHDYHLLRQGRRALAGRRGGICGRGDGADVGGKGQAPRPPSMEREHTMTMTRSAQAFAEAQRYLPGGVDSPVRAFRAVGGTPPFIDRAAGAYLYDLDGNGYIDYVGSWGP